MFLLQYRFSLWFVYFFLSFFSLSILIMFLQRWINLQTGKFFVLDSSVVSFVCLFFPFSRIFFFQFGSDLLSLTSCFIITILNGVSLLLLCGRDRLPLLLVSWQSSSHAKSIVAVCAWIAVWTLLLSFCLWIAHFSGFLFCGFTVLAFPKRKKVFLFC